MKRAKFKRLAVFAALVSAAGALSGCGSSNNGVPVSSGINYGQGVYAGGGGTCVLSFTAQSAVVTGMSLAAGYVPGLGSVGGPISPGGPTSGQYVFMTPNGSSMQLSINGGSGGYGSVSGVVILSPQAVQALMQQSGGYGYTNTGGCPNVTVVGFNWSYQAGTGQLTQGNTYFSANGQNVISLM